MSSPHYLPPPVPLAKEEQSFSFHRLLRRNHDYRWWRPLAFAGTGIGFYFALLIVAMLIIFVAALVNPATWAADTSGATDSMAIEAELDMTSPIEFAMTMASLIIMIPAVYLAYLLLGSKPVGLLISVAGKLRWRWFGIAIGTSALLFAAYFALNFALSAAGVGEQTDLSPTKVPADPLFFALLVILLTPLQCAAEELVFRGAMMQVIGSWLKHPLFAILLPVPLFTFGHLYDVYGLLDVSAFAIAAGYLSWRTGGLEAAMAMHIINNTFLFLLGAMGQIDMNASSSSATSLIFSVLFTAALTYVLVKLSDKNKVARTAGPIPAATKPPLLQPWPMAQPMYHQPQAYWAPPMDPSVQQAQPPYPQNYPPAPGYPPAGGYPAAPPAPPTDTSGTPPENHDR
ncbi:CPBP family intramembrane metalloprotease [Glutamicibacter ectropisis]|uniref:CPBP family intramembrane metalloprotease n=1 Tax=Glutamicibacter ectropisis TaxID=3046593 RepID=A0AAU6WBW4_9MICC